MNYVAINDFYRTAHATHTGSAVYAIAHWPSVCPFVCHTPVLLWNSKQA